MKKLFKQIIGFSIVGLSNTIISYIVYFVVVTINKDWYVLGNTLGFIVGTFNAYFWNSRKVFNDKVSEKSGNKSQLIKTYISYGFSLLLSNLLLFIFINKFSINEKIAPFLVLFITYPTNYLLNKFWVYKEKNIKEDKQI